MVPVIGDLNQVLSSQTGVLIRGEGAEAGTGPTGGLPSLLRRDVVVRL